MEREGKLYVAYSHSSFTKPSGAYGLRYHSIKMGCNRRCAICFRIGKEADMRRRRTMYLDDARHYYLYVFEPPMTMEEAWLPVDQISGTAVDTFVYGVACGGLFYPTKVGNQFGAVEGTASGPHSNAMYQESLRWSGYLEGVGEHEGPDAAGSGPAEGTG